MLPQETMRVDPAAEIPGRVVTTLRFALIIIVLRVLVRR